jgi:hypothetical protein
MKKTVMALILLLVIALAALIWLAATQYSSAHAYEKECKELLNNDFRLVRALKDKSCNALADTRDRALCTAWTGFNPAACPADVASCPAIAKGKPEECVTGDALCAALASDDASKCAAATGNGEQQECEAWVNRDENFFTNAQDCANAPQGN